MDNRQLTLDNNSTGGFMTRKWPYLAIGIIFSILFCLILLFFDDTAIVNSDTNLAYPVPDLIFQSETTGIQSQSIIYHIDETDSLRHETALDSIRAWSQRIDELNSKAQKPSFYQKYGFLFRWLGIFVPILIFLLVEWYRFQQRKAMKSQQLQKEHSANQGKLEIPELNFLKDEQFLSIAKKLKQPPENKHLLAKAKEREANNHQSENQFADSHPVPEPAYIVLIDRLSSQDHYARMAEMVVKSMKQAGLKIDYFFYENDPRHCYKGEVYNWVYLNDLRIKYSDHRLIMIGNGKGLIDANSDNFVDWIELLFSWKERAILSTREPGCWDEAEQLLSREFILLPASMNGLAALADHFDEPARLDMKIWKNGYSEAFKLDLDGEPNISQLKTYLGEEGFEWLSACAVYPELSWPVTLQLGDSSCFPEKPLNEDRLLHLIRLDWFQTGTIPDNWRQVLIEHFDSEKLDCVRKKLIEILENRPISNEPGHQIQHTLNIATQKWLLDRENPQNRHQLRFVIQEALKNDISIDALLYKNLDNQPGIGSLLPSVLKRWLFDQGIPILGLKSAVRAGMAILAALSAFILIPATQIPINLTFRHNHAIQGALLNAAEDQILTWSDDQTAVLWDIRTGKPACPPMIHESALRGAKFSEDENFILTWTGDERQPKGGLYIWKKADGQPNYPPVALSTPVKWAELAQKDSLILALSTNGSLNFWKMKKDQLIPQKFAGDSLTFSGITLNSEKSQILGWTDQNKFCVWNCKTGAPIFGAVKQESQILGAQFFHNESHLISWSADSTIRFREVKTGKPVGAVLKHAGAINGITISHDESLLLSWTSPDMTSKSMIYIWDLTTGKLMADPLAQNEAFQGAIFLKDNSKIITWTLNGIVQLWSIENGIKPFKTFLVAGGVRGIQVSVDESELLAWNETGNVHCWNLENRSLIQPVLRLHYSVNGACWSQKHDAILAWTQGGTAKFVQLTSLLADSTRQISGYPEIVPLGNYYINGNNPSLNGKLTANKKKFRPFVIGRYEITNAQFVQFLNENVTSHETTQNWLQTDPILTKVKQLPSGQFIVEPGFENYPVVGVNWYGAKAYCDWLTEKTQIPFRLPAETEWRYANAANLANFSHEEPENFGWFETNAASGPQPVGTKNPNVFGLYDLQGNLWEWCADSIANSHPEIGQTSRMVCGGSWNSTLQELDKTAWRNYVNANPENNNSIGFRIVAAFSENHVINQQPKMNKQSQKVKNLTTIPESGETDHFNKTLDRTPMKSDSPIDTKQMKKPENEPTAQNLIIKREKITETTAISKENSKVTDPLAPAEQKTVEPAKRSTPKSNIKVGILEETDVAKQKSQSTGIDDILNRKSEIAFDIKQQMPTEPADNKTKRLAGGRIGIQGTGNATIGGKEQLPETAGSNALPGRAGEKISLTNNGPDGQNGAGAETTGRDFNSIFPVIKKHEASINYCYERELKRNPNLKGKVVVRFIVTPKGNVSEVTVVSSTLNNEEVQQCIVTRISRWNDFGEVDASKGDATFRHVYVFGY